MNNRYKCEVPGCDAHPSKGDAIHRTSPMGHLFRGRCTKHMANPDPTAVVIESPNQLNRQSELHMLKDDYDRMEHRLNAALDELRCPECGCADEVDAQSQECGCDAPLCQRDGSETMAESVLRLTSDLSTARAQVAVLQAEVRAWRKDYETPMSDDPDTETHEIAMRVAGELSAARAATDSAKVLGRRGEGSEQ